MEDIMCLHTKPDAFTLAVMWGLFITGLSLITSSFYPFWSASAVLRPSTWWVEDAIGIMLALGAAMTLVAASGNTYAVNRRWALDRTGMWFTAAGWAGYALVAFTLAPHHAVHWIIAASFFVASLIRIRTLTRKLKAVEKSVRGM